MAIIEAMRTAWSYKREIGLTMLLLLLAYYYALAVSRGGQIDELQAQINLRNQLAAHYQARADEAAASLEDYRKAARKARKTVTGTQAQDQEHIASLVRSAIDAGGAGMR